MIGELPIGMAHNFHVLHSLLYARVQALNSLCQTEAEALALELKGYRR